MIGRKQNSASSDSRNSNAGVVEKGKGKFVLLLGDEGAILILTHKKKVVRRLYTNDAEPEHVKSLVELMESHPKCSVSILLDVLDQSYTRHTMPPVSALSVNQLVAKRLERDFSPEDIKGYIPLGREKTGRKDWNFLLISIHQSDLLKKWLDIILELPNPFDGVYLTPVEGQNYVKQIHSRLPKLEGGETPSWQMLVSHNKVGGFRQIVLHEGKLFFTRVAQASEDDAPAVTAGNIEQEIMNTIEYLRRMGFGEQDGLELFIVTSQEIKECVDNNKFGAVRAEVFTPNEVSDLLGFQQAALSGDRYGDIVMGTTFSSLGKRVLKLKLPYAETLAKLSMGRMALRAASVLIVLGSIAFSALGVVDYFSMTSKVDGFTNQESSKRSELQRIQQISAELPADAGQISELVSIWQALHERKPEPPISFLRQIAKLKQENVRITQFEWDAKTALDQAAPPTQQNRNLNAQTQTQDVGANADVVAKITLQFVLEDPSEEVFIQEAQAYQEKASELFSQYVVTYERPLTTESEEPQSIEVNFDEMPDGKKMLAADELSITMVITGPKPEEPAQG